ncbi:MAG: CFI-box-CTERM domain-containing protein [Chitinophagia bacterium]
MTSDRFIQNPKDIEKMFHEVVNELIKTTSDKSLNSYEIEEKCKLATTYISDQLLSIKTINLVVSDIKKTHHNNVPSTLYDLKNYIIRQKANEIHISNAERSKLISLCKDIKTNVFDHEYLYVTHFKSSLIDTANILNEKLENKAFSKLASWFSLPNVQFRIVFVSPKIEFKKGTTFKFENFHFGDGTNDDPDFNFISYDFVIYDSELILKEQNSNSKKCYIVTASLDGNIDHPVVDDFRTFRDKFLYKSFFGSLFCRFYYIISPVLAKCIEKSSFLRKLSFSLFVKPLHLIILKFLK